MAMTGEEKAIVQKNKSIRGWIIRSLAKGYNNEAMCCSIVNALMAEGMIISPDIGKYLDYLQDAGYIEFSNKKITAFRAFAEMEKLIMESIRLNDNDAALDQEEEIALRREKTSQREMFLQYVMREETR